MAQEHLFISDVHLGAFDQASEQIIESDLIDLIQYAIDKNARLYILGDLFDYWMEFPNSDFVPKIGKKTLDKFEEYNKCVEPCLYITGNHDNWTLGHFESLGFEVESEFKVLNVFEKNIFLMHGDGKYKNSKKLTRPILHKILRDKIFIKLYHGLLPKNMALTLMKVFSNSTRKLDRRDSKPLNNNAEFILKQKNVDIVMTGHDHIPRLETFNSGLYINLGTFFHHRTLVRGINGVLSLVQWDAQNQQFTAFKTLT